MTIANSTVLVYRKDFLSSIGAAGGPGYYRKGYIFHGTRPECRIRADVLENRSAASKKVPLSGLPFLPALQRFPVQLLPKRKDRGKLFQNELG
jgi:hypothetical protein